MKSFEVNGIHCEKCANTIKASLEDEFGEIIIDLTKEPRVVSCDLKSDQINNFKNQLSELGFDVIKEI